MKRVVIYRLVDPRNNRTRYVGKANFPTKRLGEHLKAANAGERTHRSNWLRQLIRLGASPILNTLETCDENEWQERERYWIAEMRRRGEPLTNDTDGGEGGAIISPETRQKMSASQKQRILRYGNPFKGRTHTDEIKANIAAANRHHATSPTTEQRRKISLSLLGHKHKDKTKKRMAERAQKQWADSAFRVKMAAARWGSREMTS